jgi:hypothetical protein
MQQIVFGGRIGAVALATFIATTPALGQTQSAATKLRAACLKDYRTYCDTSARDAVQPGCLRQYWSNLSHGCQQALRTRESATDE